jgi:hypothetical protein
MFGKVSLAISSKAEEDTRHSVASMPSRGVNQPLAGLSGD